MAYYLIQYGEDKGKPSLTLQNRNTPIINWVHGWGPLPNICGQFSNTKWVCENLVISVGCFVLWDVCVPLGRFVCGTFCSVGRFVPWDVLSRGTFCPWDVLSVGPQVLGTFYLCTQYTVLHRYKNNLFVVFLSLFYAMEPVNYPMIIYSISEIWWKDLRPTWGSNPRPWD